MTSFQFAPDRRTRIAGRFFARVRRELQKAFLEGKADHGLTQAKLARKLGVDRAVVCRQLAGTANITLRTLADYAWAMDRDLVLSMPKHDGGANNYAAPEDSVPTTVPADPIPALDSQQPDNSPSCEDEFVMAVAA
jgi:transcriptional regulator with XRE-family HTH domain